MALSAENLTGYQKAAIICILLGDEASAMILRHLDEDEIAEISRAITLMKDIDPKVAEQVLEDFHNMSIASDYIQRGGIEYAKNVLVKTLGPDESKKIIERLVRALQQKAGFTSLEKANPQQLSKFIQNEHPQTIALILAHLDPSQGADLLSSLPDNLRSEVAIRMANLQEISPDVVQRISAILEQKLEALGSYKVEEYGGVRAVAELLNRMDRTTSRLMLEEVETENPDLAAQVRDLMFVFDDILLIDDNGMREILKRVDKKTLATGLKGTGEEIQQQFFKNMSKRAVEMLREEMEYMGPIKIKDVEKAQHMVVEVVRQLEEEGVITVGAGSGDEFVV